MTRREEDDFALFWSAAGLGMVDVDRMAEAREALSFARTALDDPVGLPEEIVEELENADQAELDQFGSVQGVSNLIRYAIDKIDEAMGLLSPP